MMKTDSSEVFVVRGILKVELLFLVLSHSSEHAVKNVIIPLS